jgi:hypothetical protein
MNRVKAAHRFRGKRTTCSVNNVQTESAQVPVRSCRIQVCPAIGGRRFIDLSERDRADLHNDYKPSSRFGLTGYPAVMADGDWFCHLTMA